jgi:NitT/TauT family transport system permease protein
MHIPLPLLKLSRLPGRYRRRVRQTPLRRYAGLITLFVVLAAWQLLVMAKALPPYQLPAPIDVWHEFTSWVANGRLWPHVGTTVFEVVSGLAAGVFFALVLGYLIARNEVLEGFVSPIIVAMQSTPVVAYAPLLVLWFPGIANKTITSALIVFFPMLMSTVVGIRNVPPTLIDLMRVSQATRWQTFRKLEVPAAMPVLLNGLKTSATLSVIGAVVGEVISGSNQGLGHLVRLGLSQYDTPLMYVAVILLALLAFGLYWLVAEVERRVLRWQQFE